MIDNVTYNKDILDGFGIGDPVREIIATGSTKQGTTHRYNNNVYLTTFIYDDDSYLIAINEPRIVIGSANRDEAQSGSPRKFGFNEDEALFNAILEMKLFFDITGGKND